MVPFVICVFAHLVPSPPRPTLTTPFVLAPDTTIFVISLNSSVVVTFWPSPPAPVIVTGLESSLTVPLARIPDKDGDGFKSDWIIYGYDGKAAYSEDYDEFVSFVSTKATPETGYTWKDAYLVTDTSPLSETNSVGLNLVVDVEAMAFSDETMELSGKKEVFEFTDWMTGETIKETFEEGTPFDDTMIGDGGNVNSLQAANDILSGNKGDDLIKGFGGGDRLKGGKGTDT